MAQNPNGYVPAWDFGNPKVITGTAGEVISGGQIVGISGLTGLVGSGLDSFVATDIKFWLTNDPENVAGIATHNSASGTNSLLAVAVDIVALMTCAGSVFAGRLVKMASGITHGVENVGSQAIPADAEDSGMAGNIFGRAYSAGASGGYALIHIKP